MRRTRNPRTIRFVLIAGCLSAVFMSAGGGCTSVHDDLSFNQNVQNNGQRPVLEQAEIHGPGGLDTMLSNFDERIENVLY